MSADGMLLCGQRGCTEPAVFYYTWPGNTESGVCLFHVRKLQVVAEALELRVELDPVRFVGLECPGACGARGIPCRVHGCRVCGDVILADTENWPAPLCVAHAPDLPPWPSAEELAALANVSTYISTPIGPVPPLDARAAVGAFKFLRRFLEWHGART